MFIVKKEEIELIRKDKNVIQTPTYDKQKTEAIRKIVDDRKEAKVICSYCGLMYSEKPFLCLCNSNCFLKEV